MILSITKYGSSILRKESDNIMRDYNSLSLSRNLFDTLKKAGGIGLAAPQIGINKRVFIVDTTSMNETDPNVEKYEQTFINPIITWFSQTNVYYNEGCLSIPDVYEDILRPDKIRIRYQDIDCNTIEEDFEGLKARIIQHEYDHLQGVLFIDKMTPIKRKLIMGKLNKIRKMN
jgi:peptide deformylase